VSIPAKLLFVLIALRLLMPPGICVCKQSAPAVELLARALGKQAPARPATPAKEEDDHAPGCPASYLAQGLGVAPPPGPGPLDPGAGLSLGPPPPVPVALVALAALPPEPHPRPPGQALYLAHCALRF
jgi:hypothetical protein